MLGFGGEGPGKGEARGREECVLRLAAFDRPTTFKSYMCVQYHHAPVRSPCVRLTERG